MQNVPHDEWLALLRQSEALERRAKHDPRAWHDLTPLNRRIRELAVMPTTKDTWPKRIMRP